jgi:putative ATP-dependent endonuclease of OLD family
MTIVRRIEIENFRGIKSLAWCPNSGFNCLIGSGDSGKTTVLDAIDICLGARRNFSFADTDFHLLDISEPIQIRLVLGDLSDPMKSIDTYADFLRGYDVATDTLEEEPGVGFEDVLYLHLEVQQDLEPQWRLHSTRSEAKGIERNLKWSDREATAPLRLGAMGELNLSWRRGSLLNRMSEETPDASAALSAAAREARSTFGTTANTQLKDALDVVDIAAKDLGIDMGSGAQALLDVHGTSFGSGTVALHSENGVPARSFGTGSKRLLLAGMQKHATEASTITLVDEVETGLEPHRLIRFLTSLGSKDTDTRRQVFATSHSPTVLQELTHEQMSVVRCDEASGKTHVLSIPQETQGLLRSRPSSFLTKSIILCEGKTEVGFLRGFNQVMVKHGRPSFEAKAVGLLDFDGGHEERPFEYASSLISLGYRVAIFMDSDRKLPEKAVSNFESEGGSFFEWGFGFSIEQAIFDAAPNSVIASILELALQENEKDFLVGRVSSASNGELSFDGALDLARKDTLTLPQKAILGKAAGSSKSSSKGWFKNVDKAERLARDVLAPIFPKLGDGFRGIVADILKWTTK